MKEYHKAALNETIFVLIFSTLPTILGFLKIYFFPTSNSSDGLYKSGEFFLYAVGLLSSSYLVYNHFKVKKSDLNSLFSSGTIVLIVIFSLAYTIIANSNEANIERVKMTSILAFIFSVPIFYYSQVISNKHSPDIGAQRRSEQQQIEDALN
ncbi:hypothetical protein [Flavobacterium anhuiense]|uniref:hypothetical protein n=1 Tax=Flavobacterium anhuiense TaxID=459526 RepID=UPI003D9532B1